MFIFFRRQALLLWLLAILLLSLLPLRFKLFLGTTGALHSWGHYTVFFITSLLAIRGVEPRRNQIVRACLVAAFGLLLELSEVLIYHNSFEWHDLLVDALGVLTGLLLLQFASRSAMSR